MREDMQHGGGGALGVEGEETAVGVYCVREE